MERVLFCLAQSVKGVIVYIMAKQNRWQALAGKIPVIHWPGNHFLTVCIDRNYVARVLSRKYQTL